MDAATLSRQFAAEKDLETVKRRPDESDDDDDDEGEDYVPLKDGEELPVEESVVLKDHTKTLTTLTVDASGTRLLAGSYDYTVSLYDFPGMSQSKMKPFRSVEVREGHQVHAACWSKTGDKFLVATAERAKVYDRDGKELMEFGKGDPYIRDLRNVNGHVGPITSLAWHPTKPTLFATGSHDSSIRIWDITAPRNKSKSVIVFKSKNPGGKTRVSTLGWSVDGRTIAGACEDGALQLWATNSNFARPNATVEGAHEKGTATSSLIWSSGGKIATRGGDSTVKLWDAKMLKKPLAVAEDLPSLNAETNLIWSPDEKYLLTGTAGSRAGVLEGQAEEEKLRSLEGGKKGEIVVLRSADLSLVRKVEVSEASVVSVAWHGSINQIFAGCSDGSIHAFYSPTTSFAGITSAVGRVGRQRAVDDFSTASDIAPRIIAPHTLPMYKDDGEGISSGGRAGKRKHEKERQDPVKTMRPEVPMVGPGRGGRVGASATQHVVQGLIKDNRREQDPREALLAFATSDVGDNTWTSAWTETQPKPVFDTRPVTEEEEEHKRKQLEGRRK